MASEGLPYIDLHFEDVPEPTCALPSFAELVLPWGGQDGDFPDFKEVVAALFVLLHKYSHQEDLALGLLNVQAGLPRSLRTVRVTEVSSCSFEDLKVAEGEAEATAEFTQVMVGDGDAQKDGTQCRGRGARSALLSASARFRAHGLQVLGAGWQVDKDVQSSEVALADVLLLGDHLGRLLQLGRGSESRVCEWVWTSQEEDRQVLGSFNLTTTTSSCETSVLDLVARVAVDMPARSAVVQDGDMFSPLSYAQLWLLAGRVAVAVARQALPEVGAVAVLLARGVSMVLALLGVWRAGGSCVPLDLRAPRPRLEQMLRDAEVRLAITKRDLQLTWLQCPATAILYMEDFQDVAAKSLSEGEPGVQGWPTYARDDVAYVLFTSGSTGVPKGVLLTHQNVLAYTRWHVPYYQLTHEDRVPHAAGLSFDASLAEIWPTLSVGGCVLPVPDDNLRLLPEALCKWYAEAGATVAFLTTQLAEAVLAEPHYPSMRLRTLFTGGDKLHMRPPHHAPFQLVNIYGPTECCVNVTMCRVCPGEGLPSIGEPVPNMQLYVLDPDMRPQPCGLVGELCVGGPQVAAGYLNRLDLTAARFVSNPFEGRTDDQGPTRWPRGPGWKGRAGPGPSWEGPSWVVRSIESSPLHGPRLYKTGDLVRWVDDGSLLYCGRIDCQVKIRGQRIELGEIEAKMLQHQAVRECVVNCHELPDHDKILVGYWTPKAGVSDTPDLEQHLQADLPEYMIPKVFMKMDQLALTANGKVDRKALPPPSLGVEVPSEECEPEQLEAELRGVFAVVLSKKVSEVPVSASFFALGGHSISVGQLVNRIRRELQLNAAIADIYSSPSVQQLAARLRLRPLPAEAENTVTQAEEQSETRSFSYPASFQQLSLQRMASVSAAASAALNLAFCGHVRGSLKVRCLQQAFRALCCRHDALRSVFLEHDCKILSIAESTLDFRHVEMPGASSGVMGFELEWLLDQQYETFDLEAGPLCRVRVFQESEENWILHWTLHHVSADLWSYTILLQELEFAYEHYLEHSEHESEEPPPWPSRAPQYRDYALEEERFLQSDEGQRSRSYWHQKLQKTPPVLDLPGATASERKATFKGSKLDFEVSAELTESLRSCGQRCEASLHATLLTAWMVLLSRYGQEEDICVGTPMACRTTAESEATVGYFANPVCIRAIVSNTYEKLLCDVARDVTDSLQHQRVALGHVCDDLGLDLRALLQPLFVFQTCPGELYQSRLPSFFMGHEGSEISLGPLRLESIGFGQKFAQFDLALVVAHGPRGDLIGSFQYSTTSYTRDAVLRLQAQYLTILQSMAKDPSQDVGQVPLFLDEDLAELRRRVTSPWLQDLPNDSLPRLVASRAAENPSAFAVVSPQGTYTFGEVLRRAQLLATALLEEASFGASSSSERQRQGSWQGRPDRSEGCSGGRELSGLLSCRVPLVEEAEAAEGSLSLSSVQDGNGSNFLVGLMVSPGLWMVAGPLGCWMAGRGYFALDSSHPTERIQQMTQDAHPQCILCERRAQSVANSLGWPVLVIEELQSRRSEPGTLWPYLEGDGQALLVFTSGSTGRPKGVLLSMRAVLAHVLFSSQHFGFKAGQATLQHTSWTFDAPICEIWPALVSGATVVISKRDGSKDFQYLASLVDEQRVSHALFVPSLLAEILEHQALPRSLRSLVVVGEACSLSLARRILEAPLSLNNFYGPSEAGIGATIYEVDKIGAVPNHVQSLPIGRPVSWHQVILLDPQLRPALGGVGQIGILGEGLASGYLRLPQETKTRFIKTPEAIREVLPQCGPITYLTGDVGRYCQDDILEFVGRLDSQVKLRGQRVELGEIEAALLSAKAVTEAVALVHGDRLIGYFSTLQGVEEGDAVAQCMDKTRQRLPRYMWPELVHVKEWPRGRTGKVDRKALPVPTICVQDAVPPRSSLEKKILEIFCQALRRDPALTSVHSDFFTLGGTSLKAAALLSALRAQVPEAVALQFDELYAHPDVASLAQVLSGSRQEILLSPAPVEGLLPASLGQEHMLVLQELHEGSSAYNSPLILKLEGACNRSALSAALDRVIARHDVLRSNLVRDTIDGEPAVVQVTTPAAEFQCDMEFWDIPDDTAQQPQRRRLRRSHTLGPSRHVGAAGLGAPGAPGEQRARSASSFQLSSWPASHRNARDIRLERSAFSGWASARTVLAQALSCFESQGVQMVWIFPFHTYSRCS
ncbi:tycC [Symbiodinium sp. CCMP2592]|nr:tycC [Symbiodinium sp. CCMP2592]